MRKVSGLHTIVLGDNGASGVAATELHAAPISDGMGDFSELHGKSNSYDAFRLLDFGGHGGATSVGEGHWQHFFQCLWRCGNS